MGMKKSLFFIVTLILLFSSVCVNAFVRYTSVDLNLRTEDNPYSCILTVIPKGTPVTINEHCDCKWIYVRYGYFEGYVASRFLSRHPVSTNRASLSYGKYHRSYNYSHIRHYTNVYGNRVQSPTYYNQRPEGATALCRDGTYSFSQSRRGTCSHHGGVARWY